MTNEQKPSDPIDTLAEHIRDLARPWPYRNSALALAKIALLVIFASLAPLAIVVNHHVGFFEMPAFDVSPPSNIPPQVSPDIITKDIEEAIKAVDDYLVEDCSTPPCSGTDLLAARAGLKEKLSELKASGAEKTQKARNIIAAQEEDRHRTLRFGVAIFLALLFTAYSCVAQLRMTCRIWADWVWSRARVKPIPEVAQRSFTFIFLSVLATIGAIALAASGNPADIWNLSITVLLVLVLALAWDFVSSDGFPLFVSAAPFLLVAVAAIAGAQLTRAAMDLAFERPELAMNTENFAYFAVIAFGTTLVIHLSIAGFISHAISQNFPSVMQAEAFKSIFVANRRELLNLEEVRDTRPTTPKQVGLFGKLHKKIDDNGCPSALSGHGKAVASGELVKAAGRLAAVNLIVALVIIALGLEVLGDDAETNSALKAAEAAAARTWLVLISTAGILSLVVIYFAPMLRLDPYISYEKDSGKKTTEKQYEWQALKEIIEEDEIAFETQKYFGTTPQKLDMVFEVTGYGAAFHDMVKANSGEWLKILVTVASPALATTLISAFSSL